MNGDFMDVFHISRTDSLTLGDEIKLQKIEESKVNRFSDILFPNGVSQHGFYYTADLTYNINSSNNSIVEFEKLKNSFASSQIEYNFEMVRKAFFPDLPSRFSSLFALENLEDILRWPELLIPGSKIHRLNIDKEPDSFDSMLLAGGLGLTNSKAMFYPMTNFEQAYKYWNKELSEQPRKELLIDLEKTKVIVLEEIRLG